MNYHVEQDSERIIETGGKPGGMLRFRPPRIAISLMAVAAALHYFSPADTVLHLPYRPLGSLILVLGFGLMMWSWTVLTRQRTVICVTGDASLLIERPPYSFSRNPMYLGMVLMLTGGAFLLGSVIAFAAPVAFFVVLSEIFIPFEEKNMGRLFGDRYLDYKRRVRRWL